MVGRQHHDHLVCLACGELIEFHSEDIEKLQDAIAGSHDFDVVSHTHKLFGYCGRCRNRPAKHARRGAMPGQGRQGRTGFFDDAGPKP